jgi:CelD/BcsL family acetyltransferase involved in cellulose biosynthesis
MNAAAIAAPVHLPFARSEHKVEVVSDYAALLKLRSQWDELMEQAGIDHPFLSHEWVCTWWECFGAGKRLHVLLVKAGEKVVAIAPLMRSRKRMYGVWDAGATSRDEFRDARFLRRRDPQWPIHQDIVPRQPEYRAD